MCGILNTSVDIVIPTDAIGAKVVHRGQRTQPLNQPWLWPFSLKVTQSTMTLAILIKSHSINHDLAILIKSKTVTTEENWRIKNKRDKILWND